MEDVYSWLYSMRGSLKCYFCNGPAIFGIYIDRPSGVRYNYQCIKCGKALNENTLAKHNGRP